MFRLLFCAVFLLTAVVSRNLCAAPVRVVKTVRDNPTLHIENINGSAVFTEELKSFLKASGWFDLSASPQADYTIKGQYSGNGISVQLLLGGISQGSWQVAVNNTTPRKLAAQFADAIIEKTFKALKVKGFCRSKIAFCA